MPNSVISSSTLSDGYATPNEEEDDLEEMAPSNTRSVRFMSAVSHEPVALPASFDFGKDDDSKDNNISSNNNNKMKKKFSRDSLAESIRARRPRLGNNCAANCFRKWPRMYACTLGVVVPLWVLVGLCMFFGKFLGQLEAPGELDSNDAAMRFRARIRGKAVATNSVMSSLPQACYLMSKNATGSSVENITADFNNILAENGNLTTYIEDHRDELYGSASLNLTFLRDFLETCGEVAIAFLDDFSTEYWAGNITDQAEEDQEQMNLNLYFNWNRCVNRTSPKEFNWIFIPTTQDVLDAQPQAQMEFYRDTWYQQQQQLYETYMQESRAVNESIWSARAYAYSQSVEKATARQVCSVNVAAAAWFWFTIMTTVGYGNQAPKSLGGRIMVLTLGFLSILLFGTILAVSGTITSHVVKDCVHRMRCKCITRKGVMVFVWGFLAYAWMFFLAAHYKTWNWIRLSEDIDYFDAYWFAFLSSTTVGLGDYYITPEVMFINDLLAYSLSFLFAFVLLSTFLSELGQVVGERVPDLSEELRHRLKYVGVAKHFLGGKRESESELTEQQQPPNSSEIEGQHGKSNGTPDDG